MGIWNWVSDHIIGRTPSTDETAGAIAGSQGVATEERAGTPTDAPPDPADPPWWAPVGETHTELLEVNRPQMSAEALGLENILCEQLDGRNLDLPPLGAISERVLGRLRKRDCDFGLVADDIGEDQVLTAAVIRMAGSPYYRGVKEISTIKPAITRLGTKTLGTLMYNESMRFAMADGKFAETELVRLLKDKSLAGGAIMHSLAQFTTMDRDEAQLLGLMRDIGDVMVLREARKQMRFVKYNLELESFDYLCHECHQEFGELIAEAWNLPDRLRVLIGNHHSYPAADDPMRVERLLLHLTDMISGLLCWGPYVAYDLLNSRPSRDLGFDKREDFADFLVGLPDEVADAITYL